MRAWVDVDGPPWTVAETGCWLWNRKVDATGYGHVPLGGNLQLPAHRWVYELARGPIPEGLELDHLCRVRHCVNPDHLEPVTSAENVRRSPRCKLTKQQADEIRARIAAIEPLLGRRRRPRGSVKQIADEFGVTAGLVHQIAANATWKD